MSAIFPFSDVLDAKFPLSGLKVVDLTRLLPGPHATLMLGDLGADVLKVEDPQLGDYLRWGAPGGGENPAFLQLNRNKRSLTLNLKAEEGREIFRKIVAEADVLLESFRPGVMARLGLGYDDLKAINSRLVYCAISGYGQDGPYINRPGHDLNYIGFAGALGQTGPKDAAPVIPGVQIADLAVGSLMSLIGLLAALQGRQISGEGRMVDISMTGGVIGLLPYQAAIYLATDEPTRRSEWRLNGGQPEYGVYETADGRYLTVGALEPKFFTRLCELLEMPEYAEVGTVSPRADEIRAALTAKFRQKSRAEWLALLADEDVCVGPAYDLQEVFEDPQAIARGTVVQAEHPKAGKLRQLGLPFKLDGLEPQAVVREPAPSFGEHNLEILSALGYDAAGIERLQKNNIIGK